jgi:hypothetical protein
MFQSSALFLLLVKLTNSLHSKFYFDKSSLLKTRSISSYVISLIVALPLLYKRTDFSVTVPLAVVAIQVKTVFLLNTRDLD